MSGFSPEWLALREPVDHRSRDAGLAARVTARFAGRPSVTVTDLGCGSGSNLRATWALLPADQSWTLVDYDARLLAAARQRLLVWADSSTVAGDELALTKAGKRLRVRFHEPDAASGPRSFLHRAHEHLVAEVGPDDGNAPLGRTIVGQSEVAGAGTQVEDRAGFSRVRWNEPRGFRSPAPVDIQAQRVVEEVVPRRDLSEHPANADLALVE